MTPAINIPSALLTVYLGITAFTTVRPVAASRWLNVSRMLMAGAVGLTCVALAFEAIAIGGAGAGIAYPLFLFAAVALLASAGGLRMLRAGGIHGASRLRRLWWRMCFALFIAALAFFSSERRLPAPAPLRVLPVLAVLVTMLYWFWRVRIRPTVRGNAEVSAFQPTTVPPSL